MNENTELSELQRRLHDAHESADRSRTRIDALELKLAEANRKLGVVAKAIDIAEKLNNAQTDQQVALSASLSEAMVGILLEETEAKLTVVQDKLDKSVAVGNRLAKAAGCLGWTSAERWQNIQAAEAATKAWAELGYENHHTP